MGLPYSKDLVARAYELHAEGRDKDAVITLLFAVFGGMIENGAGERSNGPAHNQGLGGVKRWQGLRFRSAGEISIAEALEKRGAIFLPNCIARVGPIGKRRNREADFLIFYEGRWGFLEVDGEPFHPPARTAEEHKRDRILKLHGILICEHFDASECLRDPDGVVNRFLEILARG